MEQIRNIPKEIADHYQDIFDFFYNEHSLILTVGEIDDIIHEVLKFKNIKNV